MDKPGSIVSSPDSRQVGSGYVVLERGEQVGEHETGDGEELIVFLEGQAELFYGGEAETVHSPAVALVPAHTLHNVKNDSKSPLKYVYAYVKGNGPQTKAGPSQ